MKHKKAKSTPPHKTPSPPGTKRKVAPGLWVDATAPDELAFIENYTASDIAQLTRGLIGGRISEENIRKLIARLNSWNNPRAAFVALNNLSQVVQFKDRPKKIDLSGMKKALTRFGMAVEKCGFGKKSFFPNFVPAIRKMHQALNLDLVTYAIRFHPYTPRVVSKGNDSITLQPTLGGPGNPTSVNRDFAIAGLVTCLEKALKLDSRDKTVKLAIPLLALVNEKLSVKRVREIADKATAIMTTEPPSLGLAKDLLKKAGFLPKNPSKIS